MPNAPRLTPDGHVRSVTLVSRRLFVAAVGSLLFGACQAPKPRPATAAPTRRSVRADLVFITRDGCVNTPDMFNNLDDALRSLNLALDYQVVNLGTLPKSDPRTGYPTPTVLYRGRDVFGMPEPTPPFPEPT